MGRKKRRPAPVVGLNSDSETVGNRLTVERENELLVEENIRLLARVRALEDALQGIRRSGSAQPEELSGGARFLRLQNHARSAERPHDARTESTRRTCER
jgi:hypothetical protein